MEKNNGVTKATKRRIFYTLTVIVTLLSLLLAMIYSIYATAKKDGYETLHSQTKEVKNDLELQMLSDRENLMTMANLAAKLYSGGESMDPLVLSFKEIGLIEDVYILRSNNILMTKTGEMPAPENMDFVHEVEKSPYISGAVVSARDPERIVVRSSVPIIFNGEKIGVLYGVVDLDSLKKRLIGDMPKAKTQVFVMDCENGEFIVNTISETRGYIDVFHDREFQDGYDYKKLRQENFSGKDGFSAFVSKVEKGKTFYLHYAPLKFANWQIMLAEPEESVFYEAREMGRLLIILFAGTAAIMTIYLLAMFASERKSGRLHRCTTRIRKLLLGVNQNEGKISESLRDMANFNSAESAFFVDTDGEDYSFDRKRSKPRDFNKDGRAFIVSKLINYAKEHSVETGASVNVRCISTNSAMANEEPELYDVMSASGISSIVFSGVANQHEHISILGICNPKSNSVAQELLREITVCFSMAIYNRKYLNKTESIASTDALTGLSNRTAYKRSIKLYDKQNSSEFSCVYVDVNELHVINNKYGHAAGDGMLLFVANTLREVFAQSDIYRIGGDEFLVFTENTKEEEIKNLMNKLYFKVEEMNYHISMGMSFCRRNVDTEDLVSSAEKKMYENKAKYYQQKEKKLLAEVVEGEIEQVSTGLYAVDALLTIMSKRYHGVYSVSLDSDSAHSILMPSYFNKFTRDKTSFKEAYDSYVEEMVHSDYQRAMNAFFNYDVIRDTLNRGEIPYVEYVKVTGERIILSVYPLKNNDKSSEDTIWIFENQQ